MARRGGRFWSRKNEPEPTRPEAPETREAPDATARRSLDEPDLSRDQFAKAVTDQAEVAGDTSAAVVDGVEAQVDRQIADAERRGDIAEARLEQLVEDPVGTLSDDAHREVDRAEVLAERLTGIEDVGDVPGAVVDGVEAQVDRQLADAERRGDIAEARLEQLVEDPVGTLSDGAHREVDRAEVLAERLTGIEDVGDVPGAVVDGVEAQVDRQIADAERRGDIAEARLEQLVEDPVGTLSDGAHREVDRAEVLAERLTGIEDPIGATAAMGEAAVSSVAGGVAAAGAGVAEAAKMGFNAGEQAAQDAFDAGSQAGEDALDAGEDAFDAAGDAVDEAEDWVEEQTGIDLDDTGDDGDDDTYGDDEGDGYDAGDAVDDVTDFFGF